MRVGSARLRPPAPLPREFRRWEGGQGQAKSRAPPDPHLAGAGQAEVQGVAAARGQGEADVFGLDVQHRRVHLRVLPGLGVEEGGGEQRRLLHPRLHQLRGPGGRTAQPHVVGGAQRAGDVGDGTLAVALPHPAQPVVQVLAAFGTDVDAVRVKHGAPEEAAQPGHAAQGEVKLGRREKVGHAHQPALGVQVPRRDVHRRVEVGDHCARVIWGQGISAACAWLQAAMHTSAV